MAWLQHLLDLPRSLSLDKLDRSALSPSERLRRGWPRALPLLLLFLLPSLIAGPIRALTGLDLNLALILGIPVAIGAALPFWGALTRPPDDWRWEAAAHAVPLALAAVSVYLLFNRDFSGLYGYQDTQGNVAIDGALHTLTFHTFTQFHPNEYEGFVSLYSFWFLITRFMDIMSAANISFHLAGAVVAAAPCVVAFALVGTKKASARYAAAAVCLVAGLAVGYLEIWPVLAFHFAGGFWAHLFGLVPLCAIWWADALIRPPILRILSLLALTVLYRYTYGLNLADLLAAVGALLAIEAAGSRLTRVGRIAAGILALAAFAAGEHAFTLLGPMLTTTTGWIVPHDMGGEWRGLLFGVGALVVTVLLGGGKSGVFRGLRFPALFALANAVFIERFKSLPGGDQAYLSIWRNYYFNKYSVHAVILLAAGCVVAAAFWAATLVEKRAWRAIAGAALSLLLSVAAVDKLQTAAAPYQDVLAEVAFGHAPYPHLRPWVDREGLRLIGSTLRSERREHGGYLAAYYPLAAFMNATFGHGHIPFWERQPVETTPGHCIFFEGKDNNTNPGDSCSGYPAPWEGGERRLCWRCF
jgi:hypothetical protein